jgi:hypothetical protein
MRNTVDLAQSNQIITAALSLIANHDGLTREKPMGAMMAVTAPNFTQVMQEIDPLSNIDRTRINWDNATIAGMPVPTVKVTHKPVNAANVQTTRSQVGTTGVKPTAGVSTTIKGDIYVEPVDAVLLDLSNDLVTVDVNDYYTRWVNGEISISGVVESNPIIARIARNLYQRGVKDIMPKLNEIILEKLALAIGKIPAYPSEATPTAAAPIKTVYGFQKGTTTVEGLKVPSTDTMLVLRNMVDKSQSLGRSVLIGGDIWKEFFDLKGISAVNLAGINYFQAYNGLDFDFYYDPKADSKLGSGVAVLVEANAVGFQTWTYADSPFLVNNTVHKNMHFNSMNLNVSQFKPSDLANLNMTGTTYSVRMDLRTNEVLTSFDLPATPMKPSIGGIWYANPTGIFTTDSGNVFSGYTGVQAIKMEEYAPAV